MDDIESVKAMDPITATPEQRAKAISMRWKVFDIGFERAVKIQIQEALRAQAKRIATLEAEKRELHRLSTVYRDEVLHWMRELQQIRKIADRAEESMGSTIDQLEALDITGCGAAGRLGEGESSKERISRLVDEAANEKRSGYYHE